MLSFGIREAAGSQPATGPRRTGRSPPLEASSGASGRQTHAPSSGSRRHPCTGACAGRTTSVSHSVVSGFHPARTVATSSSSGRQRVAEARQPRAVRWTASHSWATQSRSGTTHRPALPFTRCQSWPLEALTSRGTLRHSRTQSSGLLILYVRRTPSTGVRAADPAPESSPLRSNPAGSRETLATMPTGIDHQILYRFAVGSAGVLPLRGLPPAAPPVPRPRGRLGGPGAADSGRLVPTGRSSTGSPPAGRPSGEPALSPAHARSPVSGLHGRADPLPARPLRRDPASTSPPPPFRPEQHGRVLPPPGPRGRGQRGPARADRPRLPDGTRRRAARW